MSKRLKAPYPLHYAHLMCDIGFLFGSGKINATQYTYYMGLMFESLRKHKDLYFYKN